jgi:hypothetical protein
MYFAMVGAFWNQSSISYQVKKMKVPLASFPNAFVDGHLWAAAMTERRVRANEKGGRSRDGIDQSTETQRLHALIRRRREIRAKTLRRSHSSFLLLSGSSISRFQALQCFSSPFLISGSGRTQRICFLNIFCSKVLELAFRCESQVRGWASWSWGNFMIVSRILGNCK